MTSYITLFKIRFINGLQYRIAAYAGVSTQFAWGFLNILLFGAFYAENPANFPMEFDQFVAYIWLNQAFLALFAVWGWDRAIFDDISNGNIAYELARPVDLYNMWFTRGLATRLSRVVLRCTPLLIVSVFLPSRYRLILPSSPTVFALFIISLISAFILANLYSMYFYVLSFHMINSTGIRSLGAAVTDLLSGFLIPLPFFPTPIYRVLNLLPFASMQNTPFFIYSGYIDEREAIFRILIQLFWIGFMYITGQILLKHALKKVIIQGG